MLRQIAFSFVGLLVCCGPASASNFDLHPAEGVLHRLLPRQAQQFALGALPRSGDGDRFKISADKGHILVEGTSTSALLFGVNWYLKYVAHAQISPNGDQLPDGKLPMPQRPIEQQTPYPFRYALNENVDGYTTAYWDWSRWEREIDVLALSGINAILIERGMDSVLYRTFRDFGYSDEELRNWITLPAHQNWQLMGNLCCYNGPISPELLQRRSTSAQQIIARLRELGITPVLPGFYGIVPKSFQAKFPKAHVIPQGEWAGFERPDWLDPRDPMYARIAAAFYGHQRELYGRSNIYDMEVFQEGGDDGGVPVATAAKAVQTALETANPGALWMMMAWQGNPRQDLLAGVDRSRLLIIDIDHDREPRDHRQADFQGAPFLFGGIWEFGGRTTFGANVTNITERLQRLAKTNSNMVGTGLFTEGMDTNPFAYDLFTEMAWRHEPVDVPAWTADYVHRRYGAVDTHALAAWQILIRTAYNIRIDQVVFNSERDAGQESLFNAQPSLTANRASNWSPEAMRYDALLFKKALPELVAAAPTLKNVSYDLVDVGRQTLANESRLLLPTIKAAFDARDAKRFEQLTNHWLRLMDLQEQLLNTHPAFMVGTWLSYVRPWAANSDELRRLDFDARSLLTTWGDRHASEEASLHDYGNKDWAGLTGDYYKARWQAYFNSLKDELRSGTPAKPIDWFAFGEKWNRDTRAYPTAPTGDPRQIARQIILATGSDAQTPADVTANQAIRVGKGKLTYRIGWSSLVLTNVSGAPAATISATSYVRTGLQHAQARPVLFAFNGGPGASSTPLHFSLLGPKRRIDKKWVDNTETLLDAVDLVLIDPVGTGYSRELVEGAGKAYWNVAGDGEATVQFIRDWLQRNGRAGSPVFIAGESYGGTRVAQISKDVTDLNIAGLILVSPALDYGATTGAGNDQPFIFDLPTMAVTAVAHGKVDPHGRSVEQVWNDARQFAQTEYAAALQQGSLLPSDQRAALAKKIAALIGLPAEMVEQSNLRVDSQVFLESLVPGQVVGRINTRIAAPKPDKRADSSRPAAADDPALGMIGRLINKSEFAKAYLEDQAGLHTSLDYYALRLDLAMGWDWFGTAPAQAPDDDILSFRAYYNLTPNIATLLSKRPAARVFLLGGYYDLATPLLGPRFALTHSGIPLERVTMLAMESGHTPFEEDDNRKIVSQALHQFIVPQP